MRTRRLLLTSFRACDCAQGRLTLHAHFLLNTSEVTPQLLRECLSDAASISVIKEVVDKFTCADLPGAAVESVLTAARAEAGIVDTCSSWEGVRAVQLERNEDGDLVAAKRPPGSYNLQTQRFDDEEDRTVNGRVYGAYVVDTADGKPFEVLPNGLGREHLRCAWYHFWAYCHREGLVCSCFESYQKSSGSNGHGVLCSCFVLNARVRFCV
jgi:hypothetical protein